MTLFGKLFSVFAVLVLGGTPFGFAQDAAKTGPQGTITWYTNIPHNDASALADAFEKEYPLLKMDIITGNGEVLISRLIMETRAGKHYADVTEFSAALVPLLKENHLIEPYCSPEVKFYPPEHKDKECYWTDAGASYKVIVYNTQNVVGNDIPKGWKNLLNPRWKIQGGISRIALPTSNMLTIYPGLIHRWGNKRARIYVEGLVEQGVTWQLRGQAVMPMLVAEEVSLASVSHNLVETQKKKGAPVEWVKTAQPIISQMQIVSLTRNAPHPEAAKLFIDFLLSKKGQEIKQRQYHVSGRGDMPCPLQNVDCRKLDVLVVQPEKSSAAFEKMRGEFRKIIWQ